MTVKLLIYVPNGIPKSKEYIKNFTGNVAFNLPPALSRQESLSVTVDVKPGIRDSNHYEKFSKQIIESNLESYDAVLFLGLRHTSVLHEDHISLIREINPHILITQTYDGCRRNDPADINFSFKECDEEYKEKNATIGWASDSDLNFPEKEKEYLNVLLDHDIYGKSVGEYTEFMDDLRLQLIRLFEESDKPVKIAKLVDGGIEYITKEQLVSGYVGKPYTKTKNIPYTDIVRYHNAADIFIVTHRESLGLVALEVSLAGAVVVCPTGFLSKCRLNSIIHYEWNIESPLPWNTVLSLANPDKIRNKALQNTWDKMARIIAEVLIEEKKGSL